MLPGIQEGPFADGDPARTMIVPFDDPPTTVVPVVRAAAPRGVLRSLLPWLGFGLVAVLVIVGAVSWASSMRSPQAPAAAALGASTASVAAPAAALPVATGPVPAPEPLAQPAPTARRTAPAARRTTPKPIVAAPPGPAAPAPAPTPAAPTTTPAALFPLPGWPFGPNCTDPVTAATDAACKTADPAPKAAAPKAAEPTTTP